MGASASRHSLERAKERQKLKNQRAAERNIDRALRNGKRAEDCSSWERNFLLHESRDGCVAVAYNQFCYIFNDQDVCVTLYSLPAWFGKKKRFEGKERVRDYKRYYTNYIDDGGEKHEHHRAMCVMSNEEYAECDNVARGRLEEIVASQEFGNGLDVDDGKCMEGSVWMSRDWTPMEHYLVEQHGIRNGRGDYWDFLAGLQWVLDGKEPVRAVSDEEIALRKQFAVLGKFLEPFMELYERLSKYENGIEFLRMQDLELQEYIATGNHNPGAYLVSWFEGKLDKSFYYSERNNTLLMECICEEAMLHAGKQYDAYMEYRFGWYAEHGVSKADIANLNSEYLEDVKEGRFEGTFHQYEMEFGFGDVGTYDSFDSFLEKQQQVQNKDVDALISSASARCQLIPEDSTCKVVTFEKE